MHILCNSKISSVCVRVVIDIFTNVYGASASLVVADFYFADFYFA